MDHLPDPHRGVIGNPNSIKVLKPVDESLRISLQKHGISTINLRGFAYFLGYQFTTEVLDDSDVFRGRAGERTAPACRCS